jgi:dolichol kinase
MDLEVKRQMVHSLGVFSVLIILIFDRFFGALIMLFIAIGFILFGEYRKNKLLTKILKVEPVKEIEDVIDNEIKSYERLKELPFNGAVMFFLGAFLVTAAFEARVAIASIAVLALADSISTLVGYYFGKHKLSINKKKTWEGSSAFFITAFFVLLFFIDPFKALLTGLLVTLVEMMPKINDNISVPFSTAIFLTLMISI